PDLLRSHRACLGGACGPPAILQGAFLRWVHTGRVYPTCAHEGFPARTSERSEREALRGPPSTKQYVAAYARRCRFRRVRARLMVRAFSSGGSFQGNTVISAFGASEAMSIETWSGCAVTSSGSTSIGVWHDFAKSRDTLYTKSGRTR